MLIEDAEPGKLSESQQTVQPVASSQESDVETLVDFEASDAQNPIEWPYWRKVTIQLLCASMYLAGNIGTVIIVPAVPALLHDLGSSRPIYSVLLVSVWELGEVFGPFLAGPLSERYGRLPVYHTGNILFVIFSTASALSTNVSMLIAFRFLNGLTTTSITLGPSIVGDCFRREDRGKSMAVAIAIPYIAPLTAPVIGGYLAEKYNWRWSIWFVTIFAGCVTLVSALVLKETYKPIILERKAKRLRESSGDPNLRSRYHDWCNQTSVAESLKRPVKHFLGCPTIFVVPFYSALVYGLGYLTLTTLSDLVQSIYHFSEGSTGLAFIGRGVGSIIGIFFYGATSDRYLQVIQRRYKREGTPEDRLPFILLTALLAPIGILLYGWGARSDVHWIVPITGSSIVSAGMSLGMLTAQNYLVDIFDLYSASALAVANTLVALCGTFFPLCGPPLFERLGYGWGGTTLAFLFIAWLPILFILYYFGGRIRASKRFGVKEHMLAAMG